MQAQDDGGSIVNIGSVSGIRPSPGSAVYGAPKSGLVGLTQSSPSSGPRRSGSTS
jgi:short-subunit dehydrogenase